MKKKSTKVKNESSKGAKERLILAAMLKEVPFDGWTESAYSRALKAAQIKRGEADLLLPQGILDLVELFGQMADEAMMSRIDQEPGFLRLKVREKITLAIRARLETLTPHKEAMRRTLYFYAMPFHLPLGLKRLYQTVDLMWRASGDTSTDFNFYTKRTLLAGVLKATVLIWLDDETNGQEKTWAFLDRRIADVLKIGKSISLMKEWKPAEIIEMVRKRFKAAA